MRYADLKFVKALYQLWFVWWLSLVIIVSTPPQNYSWSRLKGLRLRDVLKSGLQKISVLVLTGVFADISWLGGEC